MLPHLPPSFHPPMKNTRLWPWLARVEILGVEGRKGWKGEVFPGLTTMVILPQLTLNCKLKTRQRTQWRVVAIEMGDSSHGKRNHRPGPGPTPIQELTFFLCAISPRSAGECGVKGWHTSLHSNQPFSIHVSQTDHPKTGDDTVLGCTSRAESRPVMLDGLRRCCLGLPLCV